MPVAGNNTQVAVYWDNILDAGNSQPSAPTLTAEADAYTLTATTSVILKWTAGSDSETSNADLLTYDLRVGTTSNGCPQILFFCSWLFGRVTDRHTWSLSRGGTGISV